MKHQRPEALNYNVDCQRNLMKEAREFELKCTFSPSFIFLFSLCNVRDLALILCSCPCIKGVRLAIFVAFNTCTKIVLKITMTSVIGSNAKLALLMNQARPLNLFKRALSGHCCFCLYGCWKVVYLQAVLMLIIRFHKVRDAPWSVLGVHVWFTLLEGHIWQNLLHKVLRKIVAAAWFGA